MKMKLIFIGDDYFYKSGTIMSSLYHETGERSDWGYVNRALKNGECVHIRPATSDEISLADKELNRLKMKRQKLERTIGIVEIEES